jgi:hypothetical protein
VLIALVITVCSRCRGVSDSPLSGNITAYVWTSEDYSNVIYTKIVTISTLAAVLNMCVLRRSTHPVYQGQPVTSNTRTNKSKAAAHYYIKMRESLTRRPCGTSTACMLRKVPNYRLLVLGHRSSTIPVQQPRFALLERKNVYCHVHKLI